MDRIHQHEDHSEGKAEGSPPRGREMSPGKTWDQKEKGKLQTCKQIYIEVSTSSTKNTQSKWQ